MTTLVFQGDCLVEGRVSGTALVTDADLALSLVDAATGIVRQPGHPLFGTSVAGRVLIFPSGSGSSSGSYRLLHLAERKTAPIAIINVQANAVVTAGAVLGHVPLLHKLAPDPIRNIKSGDAVDVNATPGVVVVRRSGDA